MPIIYKEKGGKMHSLINSAGFRLKQNTNDEAFDMSGNQSAEIDSIVQSIIDNFDPVPALRAELKANLVTDSQEYVNEAILKDYPKFEVDTWQNQLDDAKAYLIDNSAVTLTLDSLANNIIALRVDLEKLKLEVGELKIKFKAKLREVVSKPPPHAVPDKKKVVSND